MAVFFCQHVAICYTTAMIPTFDPTFDDCAWTDAWTRFPIIQVVPGVYETFLITSWEMEEAELCGQRIHLSPPLAVRGLVTPDERLWMSDVPQERLMMFNNAQLTQGRVLVGGLGLGLYPQYALPNVGGMVIVEQNAALVEVVRPVVTVAAEAYGVPVEIQIGDVEEYLRSEPETRYDTIFLDTWDTLDAAHLPTVNRLRDLAMDHLTEDGHILLWGYRWMVRLFEAACEQLLTVDPAERTEWLAAVTADRPDVYDLVEPVLDHFAGQAVDDVDAALAWCREYVISAR
ncbi:MAG: hypothetical protein JXJ17_19465 [Anaerolineae bacterium]|nr:hypothetical protein [Anaerolineae bacterium]